MKNRLRELRQEQGLTQRELAKKIGIHYRTYCNYERGLRVPNIRVMKRIENVLEHDMDEIFRFTSEEMEWQGK